MDAQTRKLTWKYFFQQKKEEISEHFLYKAPYYLAVMLSIGLILFGVSADTGIYWLGWIGASFIIFWILIGLIALIKFFCNWLSSNWKKAKKRAKKELEDRR